MLFELVNAPASQANSEPGGGGPKPPSNYKTVEQHLAQAKQDQRDRYEALKAFLLALGDDVQTKTLKYYFAFRRIKNFACVEIHPQTQNILVYVKVDPDSITLEDGFTRDVRTIGHFGTGDLEIRISSDEDLEKAKPLLLESYEAS